MSDPTHTPSKPPKYAWFLRSRYWTWSLNYGKFRYGLRLLCRCRGRSHDAGNWLLSIHSCDGLYESVWGDLKPSHDRVTIVRRHADGGLRGLQPTKRDADNATSPPGLPCVSKNSPFHTLNFGDIRAQSAKRRESICIQFASRNAERKPDLRHQASSAVRLSVTRCSRFTRSENLLRVHIIYLFSKKSSNWEKRYVLPLVQTCLKLLRDLNSCSYKVMRDPIHSVAIAQLDWWPLRRLSISAIDWQTPLIFTRKAR